MTDSIMIKLVKGYSSNYGMGHVPLSKMQSSHL